MAALNGVSLPFRWRLEEIPSSDPKTAALEAKSNPTDAVFFFGVSLVLGIACRHVFRGTRVPYTVALLILGIALGSLEYGTKHGVGRLGDGIRIWENINPELLLAVFLPALLFESSFSMEYHQIKRCAWQMFLLAGPGVVISTFCLGTALKLSFPYDWNWTTSLLLGGVLSATDTVAVIALLKELGASKKLSTIIEGESLMNDGTTIVIYQLLFRMAMGRTFGWAQVVKFLVQVSLGAIGIGLAFGLASVLWIGFIFNDPVIEITLTFAVSYVAYFVAQEEASVSGVTAVMTMGMFYAATARTAFKGEGQQSLHHFWEMITYIANTLIFILSGCLIAEAVLSSGDLFKHSVVSWGYLALLYVYVQVSRAIVVGVLFPFLRNLGYGFNWKEAILSVWSGLRGAVALSLSLSVKRSSGHSSPISSRTGTLFLFFTGGIVFLTLIINGSTVQFMLRLLGMNKLSAAKRRILEFTKYEMHKKALEAFGDLGEDEDLGPADWPTVKKYLRCLDNAREERLQLHDVAEPGDTLDPMSLTDIRVRLLNGIQAAYWDMLDEGRITQSTASILMESVDEALDSVTHEPLCDWKALKSQVQFPKYYRFLQMSMPHKLVTYFTVERLETACYICAAFLRAHRTARDQLIDFIGDDSEHASLVILESEAEGEEAINFLEDVRETFPQVLRVVKTRQAIHAVLKHLNDYVTDLEKSGLLEEKEMLHLHDAVQADLKRVLRHPPVVKVPKIEDMISTHPLLGALPTPARDALVGSTKEIVKPRGVTLYKEGSKPSGIWLISNGNVKWSSKTIKSRHALHPTFTHGSTLGLFEVLTSKTYICNMVTESVVFCFYIETEKIQGVISAHPAVEDFLWKESIIVLSKILAPRVFEKIPAHDLRLLITERSRITGFSRGETIEVHPHSVCILLDGFLKSHGHERLITPPAALISPNTDLILRSQEGAGTKTGSHCYMGMLYHIESTVKVMLLDMASMESEKVLKRRPTSKLLQNIEHSTTSINPREHSGLLSWPDHRFEATKQDEDAEELDYETNNLSARAMQLSMFGSMVRKPMRTESFKGVTYEHSLSFPRAPSTLGRALTSVRSEGSVSLGRGTDDLDKEGSTMPTIAHRGKPSLILDLPSEDDSAGEDDVIVSIDSPSGLSFRQAP